MKYVLVVLCIYFKIATCLFCYWNTGCPYKFFGSKTPYSAIRGDIRDSIVKIKDCEPINIWSLIRHGKRYPGSHFGNKMKEAIKLRDFVISSYSNGKSSLCAQDVENLRNWVVDNALFNKPRDLTNEGYQDMFNLAKRLKNAYPKLLNNLENGNYSFRPAFGQLMKDSAIAFLNGLGGENLTLLEAIEDSDTIAPYMTCGKYQKEVIQNNDIYEEVFRFLNTSQYLAAKDRIQRRTGIEYPLTDQNITSLYDLCRYSWSGIDSPISPWCALFTTDDLQVLEYVDDLRHYYRNGYGLPISHKFGHIALTDLLKNFQLAKNGKEKKFTAYFTHASMMDMVYTSLDLFKDENALTGEHKDPNRKWRSSKMSTFTANLVAVMNRCSVNDLNEYNIVFYQNEEPLRSICKNGICTWQEFEEKFTSFVNTTLDFCEFHTKPLEFIR